MNFTYENQGTFTYLVYKINETDVVDSMSLGMMTNNDIKGFAPTIFTQMDTEKFLKYNVSSKVSASQFFDGVVNRKRLLGVFSGVVNGMLLAEEYMLDVKTILFDLDYIFMDVSTCEAILICVPIEQTENIDVDLKTFFRNIMFNTQFDQTENCDYVAKIISYLNGNTIFSLMDFKKVIDDELLQNTGTETHSVQPNVTHHVSPPTQSSAPIQSNTPVQPSVTAKHVTSNHVSMQSSMPTQPSAPISSNQSAQPSVAIPPHALSQQNMAVPNGGEESSEDKISLFYLLQHYNKDNAAVYKAQKGDKKVKEKKEKKEKIKPEKEKKVSKKNKKKDVTPVDSSMGFAIPGQVQPVPVAPLTQPVQPMAQAKVMQQTQSSHPSQQGNVSSVQSSAAATPAYTPRHVSTGQTMNFGETTVLNNANIGETTVLMASMNVEQQVNPHLIRQKTSEQILLNKPVFRIGKEKSYVDYFIGDNTAISRSHANIVIRENEYYVVDTNSTNHTFVNGSMIQSNMEIAIAHGDKLRLSNEEFEFRLY